MDDRLDLVMSTWLAREARFTVYVCIEETRPLGYQAYKYIILTKKRNEPLLMQWLKERHGIEARKISKNEDIRKVLDILKPIKELVSDVEGMNKMEHLFHLFPRRWTHEDILLLVNELDNWSDFSLNTFNTP
tara:strand:- start:21423 stop:21818 length:396 start_codon:yes stop_codon:yes gene_type:complete